MTAQNIRHFLVYIRKHILMTVLIFGFTVTIGAGVAFAATATQSPLDPLYVKDGHAVDEPFSFRLGVSVASIGDISISPELEGKWAYHSDVFGVIGAEFSPEQSFSPGVTYTVKLSGMKRWMTGEIPESTVTFTTEKAPGVLDFLVPAKNGVIAADAQFRTVLKKENGQMMEAALETDPAVEFERQQTDDGYKWTPKSLLPQGQELILKLKDYSGKVLLERKVAVASAPELTTTIQESDVTPESSFYLVFKEDIDVAKSPKSALIFDTPGEGTWVNATTY